MSRIERFDIPAPTIVVKQIAGPVTIEQSTNGTTEVELTGNADLIERSEVRAQGDRIMIVVEKPRRRRFGALVITREHEVAIRIKAPTSSSLQIATISGDVRAHGTFVEGQFKTVSGDVELLGAMTTGLINTVSGDVVLDAPFVDLTGKSVSGDMKITARRGGMLTVSSVSGDVDVNLIPGLGIDIEAKSLSGDLRSEIALDGDSEGGDVLRLTAKTVSGDLHVQRA